MMFSKVGPNKSLKQTSEIRLQFEGYHSCLLTANKWFIINNVQTNKRNVATNVLY